MRLYRLSVTSLEASLLLSALRIRIDECEKEGDEASARNWRQLHGVISDQVTGSKAEIMEVQSEPK